jgi:hypothetical protein
VKKQRKLWRQGKLRPGSQGAELGSDSDGEAASAAAGGQGQQQDDVSKVGGLCYAVASVWACLLCCEMLQPSVLPSSMAGCAISSRWVCWW